MTKEELKKEAEEWVRKEFPLLDVEHTNLEECITEYRAYKDGAEFGYNKANEQLTKATEIIKLLLWDLRNLSYNPEKDMARAEEFLGRNK